MEEGGEMKLTRTVIKCLTAAWITFLACVFLESAIKADREIVIRHVIDLTPIVKSK